MIYIQVTAGYVWAKEIDGVMVEVRMKRMREKEGLEGSGRMPWRWTSGWRTRGWRLAG